MARVYRRRRRRDKSEQHHQKHRNSRPDPGKPSKPTVTHTPHVSKRRKSSVTVVVKGASPAPSSASAQDVTADIKQTMGYIVLQRELMCHRYDRTKCGRQTQHCIWREGKQAKENSWLFFWRTAAAPMGTCGATTAERLGITEFPPSKAVDIDRMWQQLHILQQKQWLSTVEKTDKEYLTAYFETLQSTQVTVHGFVDEMSVVLGEIEHTKGRLLQKPDDEALLRKLRGLFAEQHRIKNSASAWFRFNSITDRLISLTHLALLVVSYATPDNPYLKPVVAMLPVIRTAVQLGNATAVVAGPTAASGEPPLMPCGTADGPACGDLRLKRAVVYIARSKEFPELRLVRFKFNHLAQRQLNMPRQGTFYGLVAQDLLRSKRFAAAVHKHPATGFYQIDYHRVVNIMLGIRS